MKYPLLWNAQDLINYLASWHILPDASIQDISCKLVATLACVSTQRVHTLSLIHSRHIFFFDSGTYLYIVSDLKVQCDRPCFVITLELLQLYFNKTQLISKDPRLFLSCQPPYKPVTTDTLARWICSVMNDAGIDILVFGAHSVRGAFASVALQNNVSIVSILQYGDWSCLKTFSRHYNRVNKYLSLGELAKVIVEQRDNFKSALHYYSYLLSFNIVMLQSTTMVPVFCDF